MGAAVIQTFRLLERGAHLCELVAGPNWPGNPKVIFLDEPTRGVDVGAKAEIHRILRSLARSGIGILMISSELPELVGLCDRVLVVRDGAITGEVKGDHMTEANIMHLASIDSAHVGRG